MRSLVMPPAVKICGLCRPEDAALAAAAGASYGGVILRPGGVRTRTLEQAAAIFSAAPSLRRVLVVANASLDDILHACDVLAADVVQLHGAESPAELLALRRLGVSALWKAVRSDEPAAAVAGLELYDDVADAVLLDCGTGGTGRAFDWAAVARLRGDRAYRAMLVLAGGLTPDNVAEGILQLGPDVVDVSSGVEAAPGEKSAALVHAFVRAARA